jgi:ABC-2 type transport system permease protein
MTTLTATSRLLRLALRRDRVVLTVWVGALAGLAVISVASIAGLYPTAAEREAAAAFAAANRLARAFDGPASGTSIGALTMTETFAVLAVLAALMSIQAVTRHTRQDEETGRAELLGSAIVGHHARLAAALLLTGIANLVLAAATTLALLAQGLPVEGSLAAGAALGAVGLTFGTIAAIAAQATESQRTANGLAGIILGLAFLLRAIGDAAGEVAGSGVELVSAWPSWLSPIGWGQQVRPFGGDHWSIFALFGALAATSVAVAFVLNARRDIDGALLATRPGRPGAEGRLSTPFRLAWRLQRGTLAAWMIGLVVLASAFGTMGDGAEELVGLSDELAAAFAQLATDGTLLDAYFAFIMGMVGIATAGFTVQSLLRARAEEASGHLETVLATAVSRHRWLTANAVLALIGTTAILALTGLSAGLTYGLATGEFATGFASFAGAAAVQLPAALVLGAFVIAVFGVLPSAAVGLGWAALAGSLVLGQLGTLLDLPQGVMNLSPFTHVPAVPAEAFSATPLLALLAAAIALAATGYAGFRRRDVAV